MNHDIDDDLLVNKTENFTEEDFRLLDAPLPTCPCRACHTNIDVCQGHCPPMDAYIKQTRAYDDAHIYWTAMRIREFGVMLDHLDRYKKNVQRRFDELPKEVQDRYFVKESAVTLNIYQKEKLV